MGSLYYSKNTTNKSVILDEHNIQLMYDFSIYWVDLAKDYYIHNPMTKIKSFISPPIEKTFKISPYQTQIIYNLYINNYL